MDFLIDHFLSGLKMGALQVQTVFVPPGPMKQWLLLEIARRQRIAMGLKIVELDCFSPNFVEIFCSLYRAISECTDPVLQAYLEGKKKRVLQLAEQLTSLFFRYGQYGPELFETNRERNDWQQKLLQKLCIEGPWKMAAQILPQLSSGSAILFGIDAMPPVYWDYFARAPSLSVYLFSPCAQYWEDLCSDRERIRLGRYWEKKGASQGAREQLDIYLRQAPRHLANWGKWGRETLKILDPMPLEVEEVYPLLQPSSLLEQLQSDFLSFQETKNPPLDSSIRVWKTGSSRLREVECLRDEILRLNVPFHEISVLSPDLEPYVPLIAFVLGEKIPFRIQGLDIAPQSSFRQGLMRLLSLGEDRWDAEGILTLFETPAFYRKQGWDEKKLQALRFWISWARIQWGRDGVHRDEILQQTLGKKGKDHQTSWEKGLDRLLDTLIYRSPMQIEADLLEELIQVFGALKQLCFLGEKTLLEWAQQLEVAAKIWLKADFEEEADQAAYLSFQELLVQLKSHPETGLFPLSVIQRLLRRPCMGPIHASHLHAVCFSRLEEGALIPAKAVFLLGMDEESFPRLKSLSSLDLLQGKGADPADRDRYTFLQAIFSASQYLRISYGHLSPDEGKPVGPSLLVQELLASVGEGITCVYQPICHEPKKGGFSWNMEIHSQWPEGTSTVSISDLRQLARHSWKFFLQKVHGIYLREPIENSFALQKGRWVRASLEQPLEEIWSQAELPEGIVGEALRLEVAEKADGWQRQLEAWDIRPFSLILRENCRQREWSGSSLIVPALELEWDRVKVRIVGEIPLASSRGLICTYEDQIGGLLKGWPEALVVALALDAPQVWMLKTGKMKPLQDPRSALQSWMEYYWSSLVAPSPLLPDWADGLLRKGVAELEKKREAGEDPVIDWVLARCAIQTAEEIFEKWAPYLREKLKGLVALYPSRGKVGATV